MALSTSWYGQRISVPGTTVVNSGATATLVAAPGAGTTLRLGALWISAEAAGGFKGIIRESGGNEIFTVKAANMSSFALTLPATGYRLSGTALGLQLVNNSGVGGTVGVGGLYRWDV